LVTSTRGRAGGHVDVVVAHGHAADGFQRGAGIQHGGIDRLGRGHEDARLALQTLDQFVTSDLVAACVGLHFEMLAQAAAVSGNTWRATRTAGRWEADEDMAGKGWVQRGVESGGRLCVESMPLRPCQASQLARASPTVFSWIATVSAMSRP
jgi:hypothetical protein